MKISAGIILKATSGMDDPYFTDTALIITEHNAKGASGFIFNKPFSRSLNELTELRHSKPFPLFEGGPAAPEKLFFIHQRKDLIEGGMHITGNLYFGGNFKKALAMINVDVISETDLKLFIGYCGWDKGQLEAEIKEGSWEAADTVIF